MHEMSSVFSCARGVNRFRARLAFKAQRLLHHPTLGLGEIKKMSMTTSSMHEMSSVFSCVWVWGLRDVRPYPEYSRANSYSWSPPPPRRARPGPGPHTMHAMSSVSSLIRGLGLQGFGSVCLGFNIEGRRSQGCRSRISLIQCSGFRFERSRIWGRRAAD